MISSSAQKSKSSAKSYLHPKINDYAVVAVPTTSGTYKNFVGQVCDINQGEDQGIKIKFLKKCFDKFMFTDEDYSFVNKEEIVRILNPPLINKKDQLLFPELKLLSLKIF